MSSTPDEGEYEGVVDAFDKMYNKEGGTTAFYSGVMQDTGKSIADSSLFYPSLLPTPESFKQMPVAFRIRSQAGEAIHDGTEKLGECVREGIENVAEKVGSNSSMVSTTINDLTGEQEGNMLGNARVYLGHKIEKAERSVKEED